MNITKYEHACVTVEKDGSVLVIDPGVLAKLPELSGVVGVIVTHIHPDHLSVENLQSLVASNPDLTIFGCDEVIAELGAVEAKKVSVQNDVVTNGPFELAFFGHDHAVIYQQIPCQNRGVLVDNSLYYPGDSFTLPEVPVSVLAFPASAPWMKVSEAVEFVKAVNPQRAFPTHNGLLSEFGESVSYRYIKQALTEAGGEFVHLATGESLSDSTQAD